MLKYSEQRAALGCYWLSLILGHTGLQEGNDARDYVLIPFRRGHDNTLRLDVYVHLNKPIGHEFAWLIRNKRG
jgi:hypothetical protein